MPVLLTIGVRQVMRQRRRSLATLIAIAVSVAAVLMTRGFIDGVQKLIKENVVLGSTGAVVVHKAGFSDNVRRSPLAFAFAPAEIAPALRSPEVLAFSGRLPFFARLGDDAASSTTVAIGIDSAAEYAVCPRKKEEIDSGRPVTAYEDIVVTPGLERTVGAEVMLLATAEDGALDAASVKVSGRLVDVPAYSAEKKLAFVSLPLAQSLLHVDGVTEVAVAIRSWERPEKFADELQQRLGDGYEVRTWKQKAAFVSDIIAQEENGFRIVVAIFALMASVAIVNTVLTLALERTREVGAMMALGFRRRQIVSLLLVETAVLAIAGSLFGVLVGWLAVVVAHHVGIDFVPAGSVVAQKIRPFLTWSFALEATTAAMGIAVLAAYYPALWATRLSPQDAMGRVR